MALHLGQHLALPENSDAEVVVKQEKIDVRLYTVIYEAINDIRAALEGLLEPKIIETVVGRVKVLQVFKVSNAGVIAGCKVIKGKAIRGELARVYRGQEVVFEGKISSLKRFKDDVKEVTEGYECGLSVSGWNGFEPEDVVEIVEVQQVAAKL